MAKTFFIDTTRCTACRGCQVACKQWHKLPAEETVNVGSHQNPQDVSFITYKLVRFQESVIDGKLKWLFFPEQCRHCIDAPCLLTSESYVPGAIIRDELTQAVLFTEKSKLMAEDERQDVRDACPYDIPRWDPATGIMAKCDMCIDRVHNGLLPACVQACPTGTMHFGEREDMMALAQESLAKAKKTNRKAYLADAEDVNVIYLLEYPGENYFEYAVADAKPIRTFTRKELFANLIKPAKSLT